MIAAELDKLRSLVRALVHGDADADDLLQDAALAALEHPPQLDRPLRPWLATVIRNTWRSRHRAATRRLAREAATAVATLESDDPIDRARLLERLTSALVALEEPFRTTVIRRYLDEQSAADIARDLGVPAGTVRWRLKEGLERLRVALDDRAPRKRWMLGLAPAMSKGVTIMKTKTTVAAMVALALLIGGVVVVIVGRTPAAQNSSQTQRPAALPDVKAAPGLEAKAAPALPPGQARATVDPSDKPGGAIGGRVVNWSTGDGVEGAELTFAGDAGAMTVHAATGGRFELAPAAPGKFVLVTATAPGFLPYAPEYLHSNIVAVTAKERGVDGITVFLYPALDYNGTVVDAAGKPVAGAKVRVAGTPEAAQVLDKIQSEWTSDGEGKFVFHAVDDAVLEAVHGKQRGWARLNGKVAVSHQLVIKLGDYPARDHTIEGRVIDGTGKGVPDVVVRAFADDKELDSPPRAPGFATSGPEGEFVIGGLDHTPYEIDADADGYAPTQVPNVPGGTKGLEVTLATGEVLAGVVVTPKGDPVPAFSVVAFKREGAERNLITAKSIVEPGGKFELHVPKGDYDLVASASGWAPSKKTAAAPSRDVRLAVSEGATVRGTVKSNVDGSPLQYARVMLETPSGGASVTPSNAGTVTRADGIFELTGLPPGPVALTIGAGGFDPKIEGGLEAHDGETIGPIDITMSKILDGAEPKTELVGIGVALDTDKDAVRVRAVIPGGSAEAAGIVAGDRITAVDGDPVTDLGLNGAIGKIRGPEGTPVTLSVQRGSNVLAVTVLRKKLRA